MNALILPLIIAAGILCCAWHFSRGRALLDRWAEREGLTIISAKYCWLWRGPFWWRSSDSNAVYRVVVRDGHNGTRTGYVRCGGLFAGMWSDAVAVEWDF
jgi:hypothetical protein